MDATQCTSEDIMNAITLILYFPVKRYPYCQGKNLKIFKKANSGDPPDFF